MEHIERTRLAQKLECENQESSREIGTNNNGYSVMWWIRHIGEDTRIDRNIMVLFDSNFEN